MLLLCAEDPAQDLLPQPDLPCVKPSSPSAIGNIPKRKSLIKCLFIRCWCLKSPKQDFNFNKDIPTPKEFKACWGNTLFREAERPVMISSLKVYSTYINPLVSALSPRVATKTPLCIPMHSCRLPSLTLSTNSHWYHSSNTEVALFHVH